MREIQKEPEDYSPLELRGGIGMLINAFQLAFDRRIRSKLFPVAITTLSGPQFTLVPIEMACKLRSQGAADPKSNIHLLVDPSEIRTWSLQRGALAGACRAAHELIPQYDVGIGIAKKGMWLSFIFSELGLETYDVFVARTGENDRFTFPMDPLYGQMLKGKRILLFDNDAITGQSISVVAEGFDSKVSPQSIDVLLISRYSHISEEYYSQIKDKLADGQLIGRSEKGKYVIDTFAQLPEKFVKKKMALESDFQGTTRDLARLKKKLGV